MRKIYDRTFWFGLALFIGTIVGVGLFGLPYVALSNGFLVTILYFVIVGFAIIVLSLLYADIASVTPRPHHLPGYAERYIGGTAKHIALIAQSVGLFGAQLAYMLVGGIFIAHAFQYTTPFAETIGTAVFFVIGAVLIWRGMKSVKETELILFFLLIAFVFLFFAYALFKGSFSPTELSFVGRSFPFLPYGIVVFSLWGLSTIPELIFLKKRRSALQVRRIIVWGIIGSAIIYSAFITAVLHLSGTATSKDALTGLVPHVPSVLYQFGLFFGIVTTFTSFLAIGFVLQQMFHEDYKVSLFYSWLIAMGVPLALYSFGFNDFLRAIDISGSVGLTIVGILIYAMYMRMRQVHSTTVGVLWLKNRVLVTLLVIFITVGAVISIISELLH